MGQSLRFITASRLQNLFFRVVGHQVPEDRGRISDTDGLLGLGSLRRGDNKRTPSAQKAPTSISIFDISTWLFFRFSFFLVSVGGSFKASSLNAR